jgi:hypothetical protein
MLLVSAPGLNSRIHNITDNLASPAGEDRHKLCTHEHCFRRHRDWLPQAAPERSVSDSICIYQGLSLQSCNLTGHFRHTRVFRYVETDVELSSLFQCDTRGAEHAKQTRFGPASAPLHWRDWQNGAQMSFGEIPLLSSVNAPQQ